MSSVGQLLCTTLCPIGSTRKPSLSAMLPTLYLPRPSRHRVPILTTLQMLPFGGQGANQAIEDAAALGCLLKGIESVDGLSARLALFEQVRIKRASLVQTLSKARVGKEMTVHEEIKPFAEPLGFKVPTNFMERTQHHFV
jgi:salicylate hydroxylase